MEKFKTSSPDVKKSRRSPYKTIDLTLHSWFSEQSSLGVPLDGVILKQKALNIAAAANVPMFIASNGWFEGWKKRFDVKLTKITMKLDQPQLRT